MNLHKTHEQRFTLPDGRQLGYAEYGLSSGSPVLYFHGMPGSSYIHGDMGNIAAQCGIRLIAVDRPGYGKSDLQPGRTLLDWPKDIAALATSLDLHRFSIIGFSGGSPYALACAYGFPEKLAKLALVGAFAPLNLPGMVESMSPAARGLFTLAQSSPDELKNTLAAIAPSPAALAEAMSASLPECDRVEFNRRAAEFEAEYARTLSSGVEGVASDFILTSGDWGFPLGDIRIEVHLWCGAADQNTPVAMTNFLAFLLPNSQTFVLPDEGHLSFYLHWEEILKRLR